MKRDLEAQAAALISETPIKTAELEALTESIDAQAWQAALGLYLRMYDEALKIMTAHQITGADIEIAKKKILARLEKVWMTE